MKTFKRYLYIFFLLFFISASSQELLKKFYYSFGKAKQTKVYKYVDQNKPSTVFYWVVTSDPANKTIRTDSYNKDFVKGDSFYEVLEEKGAILKAYSMFEKKFFGYREYKAKVIRNEVFLWNEQNKNTYFYEVEYSDQYGRTRLVKSRTFQGLDVVEVRGATYPAMKFQETYQVDLLDIKDSYGFSQQSYYVEGIGVIKYKRYIPDAIVDAELVQILSISEFEALKNQKK
jgi:hypothetical protein